MYGTTHAAQRSQAVGGVHVRKTVSRRVLAVGVTALLTGSLCVAYSVSATALASDVTPTTKPTVVSLTFDDGTADQMAALNVLKDKGMPGTLYINSGRVGFDSSFMTKAQLTAYQSSGFEIAGHTVSHVDLTTLGADDAKREICDDRVALTDMGFRITSFAYPFGATSDGVKQIVASCGYNNARTIASLRSDPYGCTNCVTAETVPPADTWGVRTNSSVKVDTSLLVLQNYVTQAENDKGGWVPIVFHHICDGCASTSTSLNTFTQFARWLATRPNTTTVRTVDQVMGGGVKPVVNGPALPLSSLVPNYGLEAGTSTLPTCFQRGSAGSNTATWLRTTDAHSGTYAERVDISSYTSGDRKLVSKQDSSTCAPSVTPGKTYAAQVWFKGAWTGSNAKIVTYYRNAAGSWVYWQTGPSLAASASWLQSPPFITAPAPAGATAMSYGLALTGVGNLTTDDYSLVSQ